MPKSSLPLGIWAPDASDRDNPALQQALTVLPIHGSYRLLNNMRVVARSPSGTTDSGLITGGFSHLYSTTSAFQYARPDGDDTIPSIGFVFYPPKEVVVGRDDKEVNGTPEYYKFIDEINPDDRDGVKFGFRAVGEAVFTLSDVADPGTNDDHIFRTRFRYRDHSSFFGTLDATLLEGVTPIESWTVYDTASGDTDGFVLDEHALSAVNVANITDYSNLKIQFDGFGDNDPAFDTFLTDEDGSIAGGWEADDGTTVDLFEHIDDPGNDLEFIQSPPITPAKDSGVRFGLPNIESPNISAGAGTTMRYQLRAKGTTLGATVTILLYQGNTLIDSTDRSLSDAFANYTITRSVGVDSITDWSDISITFVASGNVGNEVQISYFALDVATNKGMEISWCELEVPRSTAPRRGDINVHYVGTQEQLYQIDRNFNWAEVTRTASDYGQGGEPQSWSFASWGNDILATNWEDEIQVLALGDTVFSDLMDPMALDADEYAPQARFVAVVGDFVVLADINPNSVGLGGAGTIGTDVGRPDTVQWSAINNNASYKIEDLSTQSDYQPLVQTQGQITGLVGGDYGIIFKRNSIYRMDYVGPDVIFRFDTIAVNAGTAFPRSIVPVGQDVYFWGNNGIQVVRQGQVVEDIGAGQFTRYLYDSQYNPEAMAQDDDPDTQLVDSQVIGAYDPLTNCIWWLYRPSRSLELGGEDVRILVYNIAENRASTAELDLSGGLEVVTTNPNLTHIMTMANLLSSQTDITRLLMLFSYNPDGTGGENHSMYQFVGEGTQPATLTSGILSTAAITGQRTFQNIQISKVRVMSTVFAPVGIGINEVFDIPITVQITSSQHPNMHDAQTETTVWGTQDGDEWLPLPNLVQGEFFTFSITINSSPGNIREITHLQLDWQPTGEY